MSRFVIAAAIGVVVATGGALLVWLATNHGEATDTNARRDFFTIPQSYDPSGGQQMRPLWN